jgi:hypothetical protein
MPAIGVEGDFASSNPRFSVLMGPTGFISGPNGLTVGRFCWESNQFQDFDNAPAVLNNFGAGQVAGFVGRHQQALITTFLADAGLVIPQGFPVFAYSGGDFLVKNNSASYVGPGLKVFARFTDGAAYGFAAAGATAPGGVALATSSIAAATAISCTGSIAGNVLTVTAVSAGTIVPGAILTGTGVATGTQVVAQLTSTAALGALGSTGTYALNIGEQTVSSETIAGTYGVLTNGSANAVSAGGILSGTGVTAGTTVWGQLTGTTWVVSPSQTASSTTITEQIGIETKWYTMSGAAAGELLKISSQPLG